MQVLSLLAITILLFSALSSAQFTAACGYAYANGTFADATSLKGYYFFDNVAPSSTPSQYLPQGNITVEIQLCGAIGSQTKYPSICTNPNSAVNIIDTVANTCTSAGDASVAGWELNPSGNGVGLIYYHGSRNSTIINYSTRVYFECGASTNISYQFLNTKLAQYHFIIASPDICAGVNAPANATTPAFNCSAEFNGTLFDFSQFKSATGSYLFSNVSGTFPPPITTVQPPITIEIQVCGNLSPSNFANVCTTASPVNIINGTSCIPLGDVTTYAWAKNPSGAGVHLILYHGAVASDGVGTYQTRIYFECPLLLPANERPPEDMLIYEHYSDVSLSYHFILSSRALCPKSLLNTTTTSSSTSTSGAGNGGASTTTGASTGVPVGTTSSAMVYSPCVLLVALAFLALFF